MYPRGYYRCTHQKLYDCQAKKLIQRVDHNPNMFEVTYRGEHTCHMSSTAPSSYPLLVNISKDMTQTIMSPHLSPSSSTSIPGLLTSVNLTLCDCANTSSDPFTSKYDGDYLVGDLADDLFNWGGSSNNSIEPLFPDSK
ncbi:putative transcription factor WRKY family [Lupinus albus]|uniref:Putative transcription factor WRKY family n=1 Tax=Lupinus albus TaxID=3870 RepID=A0A6A4QPM5_LUPAL|nr:putative transcription factor WRKY family [Lupinus albus]